MRLISLVLIAVATLVATSATPISTEKHIQSTDEHPVNLRSVEERKGGHGGGHGGGRGGGWSSGWGHGLSRSSGWSRSTGKSGGNYFPSGFFHDEKDKRHKSGLAKFFDKWF